MVVPKNHGFSYYRSLWGVLGVPPFEETPIYIYISYILGVPPIEMITFCWLVLYPPKQQICLRSTTHTKLWKVNIEPEKSSHRKGNASSKCKAPF